MNYEAGVNSDTSLIFITWDTALLFLEIEELRTSEKEGRSSGECGRTSFSSMRTPDTFSDTVQ